MTEHVSGSVRGVCVPAEPAFAWPLEAGQARLSCTAKHDSSSAPSLAVSMCFHVFPCPRYST